MQDTLEIQYTLLGNYLITPDLFAPCEHLLRPDLFTTPITKDCYKLITGAHAGSRHIDKDLLIRELKGKGYAPTDYALVYSFDDAGLSVKQVEEYVNILFKDYTAAYLTKTFNSSLKLLSSGGDPFTVLNKTKDSITNIELVTNNVSSEKDVHQIITDTLKEIKDDMGKENHISASWGVKSLDKKTGGLYPGIFVVGGRPGMGKTALIINVVIANIIHDCNPVMIFSLEMPANQLMKRIMSSIYDINSYALKTGQITDEEYNNISNSIRLKISNNLLIIDDTPAITWQYIDSKLRAIRKKTPIKQKLITIVDYIQIMENTGDERSGGRTDEALMSIICNKFNAMWKIHNICLIELSQLGREVEKRTPPRPKQSDLKGSGSLEANADVIILQYRADYYEEFPTDKKGNSLKGQVELNVIKNRHGDVGPVYANFHGEYSKFTDRESDFKSTEPTF